MREHRHFGPLPGAAANKSDVCLFRSLLPGPFVTTFVCMLARVCTSACLFVYPRIWVCARV